jgi:hypothetical protein
MSEPRMGPQAHRAQLGLDKYPQRTKWTPSRSPEARRRGYERPVRGGIGSRRGTRLRASLLAAPGRTIPASAGQLQPGVTEVTGGSK